MSGRRVVFAGDQMGAIVEALQRVADSTGEVPTVIGGLAVLARLSSPYRATTDLDVVDRLRGKTPFLELLRREPDATAVEPAAVMLQTSFGEVKIDVLEVRQIEIDEPSDDPGDRLHASSHAWAYESATELDIEVRASSGAVRTMTARFAEPGPLIAMKLQALMDRSSEKQGTDLQDIVRLILDDQTRPVALEQLSACDLRMTADIREHVELWLGERSSLSLRRIGATGGDDIGADDMELVRELLWEASDPYRL